jgi:uncharacterized membrane protein YjfL (UPF0719 family)
VLPFLSYSAILTVRFLYFVFDFELGDGVFEFMLAIIKTLLIWILQIVVAVAACGASIYLAISIFDRTTENLDEWKEIKKGNVAVAILLGGVIFSIIAIIIPSAANLLHGLFNKAIMKNPISLATVFAINVINLLLSLLVASLSVSFTFKIINKLTKDIDEEKEIKKGNVAVAILTAIVMLATAMLIKEVITSILFLVNAQTLLSFLGSIF